MRNGSRLLTSLVGALLVVATSAAAASSFGPAEAVVTISGTAPAGEVLSGLVEIDLLSGKSATLRITNTSPAASSTLPGAPIITRIVFNLAGSPPLSCLSLSDPSGRYTLMGQTTPVCGGGVDGLFSYTLQARKPTPFYGLKAGESIDVTLSVSAGCSYVLSDSSFLGAGTALSGGQEVQWAAKFQVVGEGGEDSGCGQGDVDPVAIGGELCTPVYTWNELIGTAADLNKLPSVDFPSDSRAGSLELNFNGSFGFNGVTSDAPFASAIANLRNGKGQIVEQWQLNRKFPAKPLDAQGCAIGTPAPQCWLFYPANAIDGVLSAYLPTKSLGSNQGFDMSGLRVEVSGEAHIDFNVLPLVDNTHEIAIYTWTAPLGLGTAQLLLRNRYDWNLNGLGAGDYYIPIFRRNIPSQGPDYTDPSVTVLSETATSITIAVNVQAANEAVCFDYLANGLVKASGGPAPPPVLTP